jgi:hypothetical protein
MNLPIGTRVRITHLSDRELLVNGSDDRCDQDRFVGKCGTITGLAHEGYPEDPMYSVHCRRAGDDAFWSEELEVLTPLADGGKEGK